MDKKNMGGRLNDFFCKKLPRLFRKIRISVSDAETHREIRYIHLSPAGMVASGLALLVLLFLVVLLAVAYTPILDMVPGYRTNAARSREMLMRSLIRIDSLERRMNDMLAYNESVILVVNGKTPAMRTVRSDTLKRDKNIVPPSSADSVFRRQMENNDRFAPASSAASPSADVTNINAVPPMDGIIAGRFDAKSGLYGIRLTGEPEAQVVAITDGTVIDNEWLPESGNTITIQHTNGMVSIYRRLTNTLVGKGQRVKGSDVLGYAMSGDGNEASVFEFELWGNGKPVNPETYILF